MVRKPEDACVYCDGALSPGKSTFEWVRGKRRLLIEGVPARICDRCGEPYYRPAVMDRLREIAEDPPPRHRVIRVPVYPYEP